MALTTWAFLVWRGTMSGPGHLLFSILAYVALGGSLLTALLLASDSISREKREGTLGFLFLTDLQPQEIVIGKLAACGVVPFFTMLAMFPSFALCQLLGGVTNGEFWRVMLALLMALLVSLATTVFVSTCCTDRKSSYGLATLALLAMNPGWMVFFGFDARYGARPFIFWGVMLLEAGVSVSLLIWGAFKVAGSWRDNELVLISPSPDQPGSVGLARRSRLAGYKNPVAWLVQRSRSSSTLLWSITAGLPTILLLWASILGWANPTLQRPGEIIVVTAFVGGHLLLKVVLLTKSAHQLFTDRQDGNLELLLATPLGTEEIFAGFQSALRRQFALPLVMIILLDAGTAVFFIYLRWNAGFVAAACGALLWFEFVGIIWTGVWRILMGNHAALGIVSSALRAILIPAAVGAFALVVFHSSPPMDKAFMWVIANVATLLWLFIHARSALLKHGRTLLLRPYGEAPPHIESDWSAMNWEEAAPSVANASLDWDESWEKGMRAESR